jgi:hypothetical protein
VKNRASSSGSFSTMWRRRVERALLLTGGSTNECFGKPYGFPIGMDRHGAGMPFSRLREKVAAQQPDEGRASAGVGSLVRG